MHLNRLAQARHRQKIAANNGLILSKPLPNYAAVAVPRAVLAPPDPTRVAPEARLLLADLGDTLKRIATDLGAEDPNAVRAQQLLADEVRRIHRFLTRSLPTLATEDTRAPHAQR